MKEDQGKQGLQRQRGVVVKLVPSWVVKPEAALGSVNKQPRARGQKANSEEGCVPGMCLNCF